MKEHNIRIAVVSDDGANISQHFGRAPYYVVVTVNSGVITGRETVEKLAHGHGIEPELHLHSGSGHGPGHGMGPAEHDRHTRMSDPIADCEALICRGMGQGAYVSLTERKIRPVITDITSIDEAVAAYVAGTIVDHTERLH